MDTHALKIKYYKQTHTLGYHPKKAKQNFDLRNTIQKTIINELDHWFFFLNTTSVSKPKPSTFRT